MRTLGVVFRQLGERISRKRTEAKRTILISGAALLALGMTYLGTNLLRSDETVQAANLNNLSAVAPFIPPDIDEQYQSDSLQSDQFPAVDHPNNVATSAASIVENAEPLPSMKINDNGVHVESDIAVSPCDPDFVAVTANYMDPQIGTYKARVDISHDGGQSFSKVLITGFPPDVYRQVDPVLTFSQDCSLYYAALVQGGDRYATGGFFVVRSHDGISWETPKLVAAPSSDFSLDKPWITASETDSRLVVCGTHLLRSGGWRIYCTQSPDGNNWSNEFPLPDPSQIYNTAAEPKFGLDGSLYIASFSFDNATVVDTVVYRLEGDGTLSQRIVARQPYFSLGLGFMPGLIDDGSRLHLTWSDSYKLWHAISTDRGDSWSVEALGDSPGVRFIQSMNCQGPNGELVIGSYAFRPVDNTFQLHLLPLSTGLWYPVSPRFPLFGNINDRYYWWGAIGDYNDCDNNHNPQEPGVFTSFTANVNIYTSGARLEPWGSAPVTAIVFRPISGTIGSGAINVLNQGLSDGQFQAADYSKVDQSCPDLSGIPTAPVTVPARRYGQIPIAVGFDVAASDKWCEYSARIVSLENGQSENGRLRAWQGEPSRIFLPQVERNSLP